MEEAILLEELTKNCEGQKEMLMSLMQSFDIACLGYEMQEEHEKDIYNRVLRENEFFCSYDFNDDFKVGDRITEEKNLYLLSDEDTKKVINLAHLYCVEEKLTDENGYYLEDWMSIRTNVRYKLVDFIINNLVPESLRKSFDVCRWNIVYSDKLINTFKTLFKKAA